MRIASITKDKELEVVGEVMEYPFELSGGRNLVLKGGQHRTIAKDREGWLHYILSRPLTKGKTYRLVVETLQLPASANKSLKLMNRIGGNNYDVVQFAPFNSYFTPNSNDIVQVSFTKNRTDDSDAMIVQNIAIYEGSKSPGEFTPAPEDLGLSYPDSVQYFAPSLNAERVLLPEISELDNQFSMSDKHTITHEIKEL